MKTDFKRTVTAVKREVERAKTLHPGNFHGRHEAYAVLLEEVDELWEMVKKNPAKMLTPADKVVWRQNMHEEAIQVAAMAVRFATEVC